MAKPVALANFGLHVEILNKHTNFLEQATFRFETEELRDEFTSWAESTSLITIHRPRKFTETVHPDFASARDAALRVRDRPIHD